MGYLKKIVGEVAVQAGNGGNCFKYRMWDTRN